MAIIPGGKADGGELQLKELKLMEGQESRNSQPLPLWREVILFSCLISKHITLEVCFFFFQMQIPLKLLHK